MVAIGRIAAATQIDPTYSPGDTPPQRLIMCSRALLDTHYVKAWSYFISISTFCCLKMRFCGCLAKHATLIQPLAARNNKRYLLVLLECVAA